MSQIKDTTINFQVRVKPAIFLLRNNVEDHINWSLFATEEEAKLEEYKEEEIEDIHEENGGITEDDGVEGDSADGDAENIKVTGSSGAAEYQAETQPKKEEDEFKADEDSEDKEENDDHLDDEEEHPEPKLPGEGCFAPEGSSEILLTTVDSTEPEYSDEMPQSTLLQTQKEEIVHEEVPVAGEVGGEIPEEKADDIDKGFCSSCDEIGNGESAPEVIDYASESDILVNPEEAIPSERLIEEEEEGGGEKQTFFVEMSSSLEEDLEVSANELKSEPQITSVLSDNNPENVEHVHS